MKFKSFLTIALVLVALLVAGCTNSPPSGGTPPQGGQLLGSAVDSAEFSIESAPTEQGDNALDLGDLADSGLTEGDLQ
jgi:hypothetical protein